MSTGTQIHRQTKVWKTASVKIQSTVHTPRPQQPTSAIKCAARSMATHEKPTRLLHPKRSCVHEPCAARAHVGGHAVVAQRLRLHYALHIGAPAVLARDQQAGRVHRALAHHHLLQGHTVQPCCGPGLALQPYSPVTSRQGESTARSPTTTCPKDTPLSRLALPIISHSNCHQAEALCAQPTTTCRIPHAQPSCGPQDNSLHVIEQLS